MISKDTKITYFIYAPYECTAVEEYLEQMAAKGWLLHGIKGPLFKFKKIIPQKIKYSVDALNKISIFDHKDPEVALEFREYCNTAGWTYICQTGKIQIFYAEEDKKVTPIHTDEDEKFKAVFKSSLYQIFNQLVIVVMMAFNIYIQSSDTDYLLSSNSSIFLVVVMFFIIFINIIKFISFFLWVIKARRKLKENKFTPYNTYSQLRIKNIVIKTYTIVILFAIVVFLGFDYYTSKNFSIVILILLFIFIIIPLCIQMFINKKKYSKTTNLIIAIGSYLSSIFLLLFVVSTAISNIPTEVQQNEWSSEKPSLTLMDFGYEENTDGDAYIDFNKSILAQRNEYSDGNKDKNLTYTIFQSNYPWAIRFHETRLVSRFNNYDINLKHTNGNLPDNIKVYSDSKKSSFILVSENKVVNIRNHFSNISDDDFLNIVYKKLFIK